MVAVCIFGSSESEWYSHSIAETFSKAGHKTYLVGESDQYLGTKNEFLTHEKVFCLIPLCSFYIITSHSENVREKIEILTNSVGDPNGRVVVIESPVPVGFTRKNGKSLVNAGFKLCYSPRIHTESAIKIIAGIDQQSAVELAKFYNTVFPSVHAVSSLEVAEAGRLLVGIYRATNFSLANEFKTICDDLNINIYEVVDVATKCGGTRFHPFVPWVGIGGDSAEDPIRALSVVRTPIIKTVSNHVVTRPKDVVENIKHRGKILIVGVGHKPHSFIWKSSPVNEFIANLECNNVHFWDPYIPYGYPFAKSIGFEDAIEESWDHIFVMHPYVLSAWKGLPHVTYFCQIQTFDL